jgi:hypothetical protein
MRLLGNRLGIRLAFVVPLASGCSATDRELDLAEQIMLAEDAETTARRELVRLERERETAPSPELTKQITAQREVVRAAEISARKLRIQSKQ